MGLRQRYGQREPLRGLLVSELRRLEGKKRRQGHYRTADLIGATRDTLGAS